MKPESGVRRIAALALIAVVGIANSGCGGGGGATDADSAASPYTLTVRVTNDSGIIGSIAIDLHNADAGGEFATADDPPDCEVLAPDAFALISVLAKNRIRIGVASFIGFDTPVELARCRIPGRAAVDPTAFSAELVEVSAPDGALPRPPPQIELTAAAVDWAGSTTTLDAAATAPTTTLQTE